MEKSYTLWQRISGATPLFFKRAQALGVGLVTLGSSLIQVEGIPAKITTALISIGTAITVLAQFAVKQSEPITTQSHDDIK